MTHNTKEKMNEKCFLTGFPQNRNVDEEEEKESEEGEEKEEVEEEHKEEEEQYDEGSAESGIE